jgi:hypothetical protein
MLVPIVVLLSLPACAERRDNSQASEAPSQTTATESSSAPFGAPPVPAELWTNPLGATGEQVASVSSAALQYSVLDPTDQIGSPDSILVSDPAQVDQAERQIAWVYSDGKYESQFFILERAVEAKAAQAEYESLGKATPGCSSVTVTIAGTEAGGIECNSDAFSLVSLPGGIEALLAAGPEVTSLTWVEPLIAKDSDTFSKFVDPGLEVKIMGPASTLSSDEATAIASSLLANR